MAATATDVSFAIEVFAREAYPERAAGRVAETVGGAATLVLTGGTTAAEIYPHLSLPDVLTGVFFSDERCVPPDDDASNFRMASERLRGLDAAKVHRMRGELDPEEGAARYSDDVAPFVERGFDVMLLGMGADCHICALFPGSPALDSERYCAAVDRPDGLRGLTLTPATIPSARTILLVVTGDTKADAVRRVIEGDEKPHDCPARLLADHPNATFLLDEPAAALLS